MPEIHTLHSPGALNLSPAPEKLKIRKSQSLTRILAAVSGVGRLVSMESKRGSTGPASTQMPKRMRTEPADASAGSDGKKSPFASLEEEMQEAVHYTNILRAYGNYPTHCFRLFSRLEADFRRISKVQQSLVPGFDSKMAAMKRCVGVNQEFIRKILNEKWVFQNSDKINYNKLMREDRYIKYGDMEKVMSTLKQCMRDWSAEGARERGLCYGPLLKELKKRFPRPSLSTRVLVPGCGLARLVWEVANAGYHAQGNEFSYFMLLCSFVILNRSPRPECHTVHPFVTQSNNTRSRGDQLRSVRFPDVNASQLADGALSMVAGDFQEVYEKQVEQWDCLCTCFFIDTANNIIEYIRLISSLLKVGGYWINFGPLLYHYSGMNGEISVELTWDEVKACFAHYGLRLVQEEHRRPATYCQNTRGMMKTEYSCVFSTCVKESKTPVESPAPRYAAKKAQAEGASGAQESAVQRGGGSQQGTTSMDAS